MFIFLTLLGIEFNNGIKAPEIKLNNSLFRLIDNDKLYIIRNEYNQ